MIQNDTWYSSRTAFVYYYFGIFLFYDFWNIIWHWITYQRIYLKKGLLKYYRIFKTYYHLIYTVLKFRIIFWYSSSTAFIYYYFEVFILALFEYVVIRFVIDFVYKFLIILWYWWTCQRIGDTFSPSLQFQIELSVGN